MVARDGCHTSQVTGHPLHSAFPSCFSFTSTTIMGGSCSIMGCSCSVMECSCLATGCSCSIMECSFTRKGALPVPPDISDARKHDTSVGIDDGQVTSMPIDIGPVTDAMALQNRPVSQKVIYQQLSILTFISGNSMIFASMI